MLTCPHSAKFIYPVAETFLAGNRTYFRIPTQTKISSAPGFLRTPDEPWGGRLSNRNDWILAFASGHNRGWTVQTTACDLQRVLLCRRQPVTLQRILQVWP